MRRSTIRCIRSNSEFQFVISLILLMSSSVLKQ